MLENKDKLIIKKQLILQSYTPLFILLLFRHCNIIFDYNLFYKFLTLFILNPINTLKIAFHSNQFFRVVTCIICILWIIFSIIYSLRFKYFQTYNFTSNGDYIKSIKYSSDISLNFFTSYLLPLLIDINNINDFLVFIFMLMLMLVLIWKSNLFYQNPLLFVCGYKTFTYSIKDNENNTDYIGITYKNKIDISKTIKVKNIYDNVYIVFNDLDY